MRALSLLLALISAPAYAASDPTPVFVTLGTGGGPVVQFKRSQPANAVVMNGAVYLFDTGEGTQRQMKAAGLPLDEVRAVFLSHHHLDHVGGLMPLLVNRWIMRLPKPIPVFGPPGTKALVAGIIAASQPIVDAPLTIGSGPTKPFATTVVAQDLSADMQQPTEIYRDGNIRVTAISVDHYHSVSGVVLPTPRSYAFRIEGGGRSIVFSGDTGPSVNLERLAKDADLLVTEVADRPAIAAALRAMNLSASAKAGFIRHMELDHLSPTEVGELARRAKVKRVVLTHLVPGRDEETGVAGYLAGLGKQYGGPVVVAQDGERF